jgi:hypothetical protein
MGVNTDVGMNQSGKSGGDAMGTAGVSTGDAYGHGEAAVFNVDPIGTGIADGGSGYAGQNAGAATGGDVADNTSIGSVNINS